MALECIKGCLREFYDLRSLEEHEVKCKGWKPVLPLPWSPRIVEVPEPKPTLFTKLKKLFSGEV